MMIMDELEQFAKNKFATLPRKALPAFRKDLIWLKIEPELREHKRPQKSWVSDFVFLRLKLSRVLATLVIMVLLIGLVRGSAQAIPGETLYPVKKATETVEKILAVSQENKVKVGIKHAKRRLTEVQILIATNQGPEIVAATVEELTKTTSDTAAVSAEKPELATQVVELANQQEQILETVSQDTEGQIKEALEKAITMAKESASTLNVSLEGNGEVEGTSATTTLEATTTPTTTTSTQPKPKPKDGVLESEIQIHGVTEAETTPETTNPPDEPVILPEPTIGF